MTRSLSLWTVQETPRCFIIFEIWIKIEPWRSRSTKDRMRALGREVRLRRQAIGQSKPLGICPDDDTTDGNWAQVQHDSTLLTRLRGLPLRLASLKTGGPGSCPLPQGQKPRLPDTEPYSERWAQLGLPTQLRPQGPRELISKEEGPQNAAQDTSLAITQASLLKTERWPNRSTSNSRQCLKVTFPCYAFCKGVFHPFPLYLKF